MRALLPVILTVVLVGGCAAAQQRNDAFNQTLSPVAPDTVSPTFTFAATTSLDPTASPGPLPPTSGPSVTDDPMQPHMSPTPVAGPYDVDLYRKGAFVSEVQKYMCLSAAMQVMINIMKDGPVDTSAATQWRLYDESRTFLIEPYTGTVGAQPEGWAATLNAEGYGPYQMAIRPTMEEAIHLAAKQIRLTGKPVGLLVWRGAHSWAMSGFRSDIDPLLSDNFTVQGIYAEDVWYPRISSIWGPSFPPDTFDPYALLPIDYLHYKRPREIHPDKDGQWVLIVPTLPNQGVV